LTTKSEETRKAFVRSSNTTTRVECIPRHGIKQHHRVLTQKSTGTPRNAQGTRRETFVCAETIRGAGACSTRTWIRTDATQAVLMRRQDSVATNVRKGQALTTKNEATQNRFVPCKQHNDAISMHSSPWNQTTLSRTDAKVYRNAKERARNARVTQNSSGPIFKSFRTAARTI
jgi:hypothetical protein